MKEARVVQARKDQQLVALPAPVRKHLGVLPGTRVWFHLTRAGQVVLTTGGQVKGGRPRLNTDCPECAKYRRELDRLAAAGRMREVADYNNAFNQGYERALKDLPLWRVEFGTLREGIEDLRMLLVQLQAAAPERRAGAALGLPPGVVAIDVPPPDTGEDEAPRSMESPPSAPSPS